MNNKYFEDQAVVKDDFIGKINDARKRDRYLNTDKAYRPEDIQKKKDAERMKGILNIAIIKKERR